MLPSFHLVPNCQWCHLWWTCILTLIKQFGEGFIKFEKVASIMKQGGNKSSKSRSKSRGTGQQRWRTSRSSSYRRAVRRNMIRQPPSEFSFAIKDSFFNSATARSFLSCSDNRLLKIEFLIQLPSVSIHTACLVVHWVEVERGLGGWFHVFDTLTYHRGTCRGPCISVVDRTGSGSCWPGRPRSSSGADTGSWSRCSVNGGRTPCSPRRWSPGREN